MLTKKQKVWLIRKNDDFYFYYEKEGLIKQLEFSKDNKHLKDKFPENTAKIIISDDSNNKSDLQKFLYKIDSGKYLITTTKLTNQSKQEVCTLTNSHLKLCEENQLQKFLLNNFVDAPKKGATLLDIKKNGQVTKHVNFLTDFKETKLLNEIVLPPKKEFDEYDKLKMIDSLLNWQRDYLFELNQTREDLKQVPVRVVSDIHSKIHTGMDICDPTLEAMKTNLSAYFSAVFQKRMYCVSYKEDFTKLVANFKVDESKVKVKSFSVEDTRGLTMAKKLNIDASEFEYRYLKDEKLGLIKAWSVKKNSDNEHTVYHFGYKLKELLDEVSFDIIGQFFLNGSYDKNKAHKFMGFIGDAKGNKPMKELVVPELNKIGLHILEMDE